MKKSTKSSLMISVAMIMAILLFVAVYFLFGVSAAQTRTYAGKSVTYCENNHACWEAALKKGDPVLLHIEKDMSYDPEYRKTIFGIDYLLEPDGDGYRLTADNYFQFVGFDESYEKEFLSLGFEREELYKNNQIIFIKKPELDIQCSASSIQALRGDIGYGSSTPGTSDGLNLNLGNPKIHESIDCSKNNLRDLLAQQDVYDFWNWAEWNSTAELSKNPVVQARAFTGYKNGKIKMEHRNENGISYLNFATTGDIFDAVIVIESDVDNTFPRTIGTHLTKDLKDTEVRMAQEEQCGYSGYYCHNTKSGEYTVSIFEKKALTISQDAPPIKEFTFTVD